jgi:hypothetical protein
MEQKIIQFLTLYYTAGKKMYYMSQKHRQNSCTDSYKFKRDHSQKLCCELTGRYTGHLHNCHSNSENISRNITSWSRGLRKKLIAA